MPIYEVEANGKTYEVDAPSMEIAAASFPQGSPGPGNQVLRAGNAVGQGLINSLAEAAGFLPDLSASAMRAVGGPAQEDPHYYTNAIKAAARKVGELGTNAVRAIPGIGPMLTAPAGGPAEAQNALERGLYGVGHGVGDALSMAVPAGVVANATKAGTLTNGVARTLASSPVLQAVSAGTGEGVGEATQNPLLGLAAGLAVPTAKAGYDYVAARRAASKAIPTAKELAASASAAYKDAAAKGVLVKRDAVLQEIDNIESQARNAVTYRPSLQPKTATAFDAIRDELKNSGPELTIDDLEAIRRMANTSLESQAKSDRNAGHYLIDKFDDFMGNLSQSNAVVAGNSDDAVKALESARDYWTRKSKAETIGRVFYKAENKVGANYTQAGYQTALRQGFKALADNERAMSRFSPDEREAILKVVRGGAVENFLRHIGKWAPRGQLGALMTGGAGYAVGGVPGMLALGAAGEGARAISTGNAIGNARLVDELVRSGGKGAQSVPMLTQQYGDQLARLLAQSQMPNSAMNPMLLQVPQGAR